MVKPLTPKNSDFSKKFINDVNDLMEVWMSLFTKDCYRYVFEYKNRDYKLASVVIEMLLRQCINRFFQIFEREGFEILVYEYPWADSIGHKRRFCKQFCITGPYFESAKLFAHDALVLAFKEEHDFVTTFAVMNEMAKSDRDRYDNPLFSQIKVCDDPSDTRIFEKYLNMNRSYSGNLLKYKGNWLKSWARMGQGDNMIVWEKPSEEVDIDDDRFIERDYESFIPARIKKAITRKGRRKDPSLFYNKVSYLWKDQTEWLDQRLADSETEEWGVRIPPLLRL